MSFAVNQLIGFGARRAAASGGLPGSFGADVTTTGFAIAGSDQGASYVAANAFNNNTGDGWIANVGASSTTCWVGQNFGAANNKNIRKLTLRNTTAGGISAANWFNHLKLRYSDDGSTWSEANEWTTGLPTLTKTDDGTTTDTYFFQDHGAHRYWSVIGIDGVDTGYYGGLGEVEMMEGA